MLAGMGMLLRRRRAVFQGTGLAVLLAGILVMLLSGRSSIATASLVVTQPPDRQPWLDDQFALLVGRYCERFRQLEPLAAWLVDRGLPIDPVALGGHLAVEPDLKDGCVFRIRVTGARAGFTLLLLEEFVSWARLETPKVLQEHLGEMLRFQEQRLAALQAESVELRRDLDRLRSSLRVKSVAEGIAGLAARQRRLQADLRAAEKTRRQAHDRLFARRPPARRSSSRSTHGKAASPRSRQPLSPERRALLEKTLRLAQARKVALKAALTDAARVTLVLRERLAEEEDLLGQLRAREEAVALWTRRRDFTLLQERAGVGRLVLSAGPVLADAGWSLFQPWVWIALGLLSLAGGMAGAVVADGRDATVRSPFVVPMARSLAIRGCVVEVPADHEPAGVGLDEAWPGEERVWWLAAEPSLLALRDQILSARQRRPFRSLALAPPTVGGGCSTLSASLAVALARSGLRVLLIDADLGRPAQRRNFGLPPGPGLTAWRPGEPVGRYVHPSGIPGLLVLPSGLLPPDPVRFWGQPGWTRSLLEAAQAVADLILLDLPPVTRLQDDKALFPFLDRLLLVAGVGLTPVRDIQAACDFLRGADRDPAGFVYNRVPAGEMESLWRMA